MDFRRVSDDVRDGLEWGEDVEEIEMNIHGEIQNELFPIQYPKSCLETECNNVLVSISGGRTSCDMGRRMKASPYWSKKNLVFVFSNTGREREETLVFTDRCDREFGFNLVWVEASVNPEQGEGTTYKRVDFKTASRNGEPFEAVIKKYGIPNAAYPHCNRELKINPINSFAREYFKGEFYVSAIGIRADEMSRVKLHPSKIYPMVGFGATVASVRGFWNSQCFDLELKDYEGNCKVCWKKSQRKILTEIKENPAVADWNLLMEELYSSQHGNHSMSPPYYFNRKHTPMKEIVRMAKGAFVPATDPFWKQNRSDEMDAESACACMNEE